MGLRERYVQAGPGSFGDAEIVALVLGTGTAGTPALGVARALLERFGDVRRLLQAEPSELAEVRGVGTAKAIQLHAALQLGRRAQQIDSESAAILDPGAAHALMAPRLLGLVDEELHALFLDRRRRVLAHRALTRGCHAFTIVDARQIFRTAVRLGASAVLIAHNHPSGDPEPSSQDVDVTHQVARAGRVLGVPLVDHLVIAERGWTSMAERGHVSTTQADIPLWTP